MPEKFGFTHIISIHALRVEGDAEVFAVRFIKDRFLSTPSGWRATNYGKLADMILGISIHALRVEGDGPVSPLGPCAPLFLSTPSGWRAT